MFELLQQIGNTVKLKHSSHSLAMMKAGGRGGVTGKRKRAEFDLSQALMT
jgi:hypothetical protein